MKDVFLEVLVEPPLRSVEEGRRFMALLEEHLPDWLPGRWGHDEPLRRTYTPDQLDEAWSDELLWKGRGARVSGSIHRPLRPGDYSMIHLEADSSELDLDASIRLLEGLGMSFGAAYGFLHLATRLELEGAAPDSVEFLSADEPNLFVAEHRLRQWLPDLFWANLFGPPYVELFGKDRIASAPAYAVEQIGSDLFYVQVTERLEDVRERWDEYVENRDRIKRHLGENAFWDASLGEEHAYDVPTLAPSAPAM